MPRLNQSVVRKLMQSAQHEDEECVMSQDYYDEMVRAYEAEGMTRSDAQAVVDAEETKR